jgi:uncharacterized protein YjcR
MHSSFPMHQSKRCQARSKRTGRPCRSPAVKGYDVCRMHGARGGAPKGNQNALKHGRYTAEVIQSRRYLSMVARMAQQTLRELDKR